MADITPGPWEAEELIPGLYGSAMAPLRNVQDNIAEGSKPRETPAPSPRCRSCWKRYRRWWIGFMRADRVNALSCVSYSPEDEGPLLGSKYVFDQTPYGCGRWEMRRTHGRASVRGRTRFTLAWTNGRKRSPGMELMKPSFRCWVTAGRQTDPHGDEPVSTWLW